MKIKIQKNGIIEQEIVNQIATACYVAFKKEVNPLPDLRKKFEGINFKFTYCDGWDMPYYQPFPGFSGFVVGKKETDYTEVQVGFCINGNYQNIVTIQ